MPSRERVGVVVALVAVGLFCSSALALPARSLDLYGLSFTLTGRILLGLVLLGLTGTGVEHVLLGHPRIGSRKRGDASVGWVLPVSAIAVAYTFLSQSSGLQVRVMAVLAAGAALSLLVIAEYVILDSSERWLSVVQFSLHLVAYLLGVLLYRAIAMYVSSAPVAMMAVAAVSAMLGLRLLSAQQCPPSRTWPYVLGQGALLGIGSSLLNRWEVSPLSHSLVLTVLLYVLTGVVRQFLLGKLTRQIALEYVLAGGLVLLLLLSYAR
ncbi:MAG TPA: hypothetical protein VMY98_07210 [Anaerolineae bacterium]|nr:hypothetical protein [Anaerolineae bacterium]